ncbi:hypothetical protein GCM10027570_11780 [Streptomonospora sediminis]
MGRSVAGDGHDRGGVGDGGRGEPAQVVLEVLEKDRAAIRLYERMGRIRIGTFTHAFGEVQRAPALVYALPG